MLGLGCPFRVSCCSQEMPVTQVCVQWADPASRSPPQGRGPELGAPLTLSLNSALFFSYAGVSDTPPVRDLIESPKFVH